MTAISRVAYCAIAVVCACTRQASPPPEAESASFSVAPKPAQPDLADLDPRTPVPLLPVMALHQRQSMREHLEAVQGIVAGLALDKFSDVEAAAQRIGTSEQMGQMCHHMGAGAPGFTEQALGFHHTADRIVHAARAGNRAATLEALSATLQACTACHSRWKQQVVDEVTWQKLTASAPPHQGAR